MRLTTAAMILLVFCVVVFTIALALTCTVGPRPGFIFGMVGPAFGAGTCLQVLLRGDR